MRRLLFLLAPEDPPPGGASPPPPVDDAAAEAAKKKAATEAAAELARRKAEKAAVRARFVTMDTVADVERGIRADMAKLRDAPRSAQKSDGEGGAAGLIGSLFLLLLVAALGLGAWKRHQQARGATP
jgi:hypothetical protein